jgi:hypothetical protein
VAGDIDGDGDDEFLVTVRRPEMTVEWFDRASNGRWKRHVIDEAAPPMGVGGVLVDVAGKGRLDFISGTDARSKFVYWWEQPDDPTRPWARHVAFELPSNRTHDSIVEDFDGDGRTELVIWNQGAKRIFHVPLPADPHRSPWPDVRTIAEGVEDQALAVADIDGDGRPELIAGCSWYKLGARGGWQRHVFTDEFRAPRLGAADFDGDGRPEIALCESDGSFSGITYGRLAVFKPGRRLQDHWTPRVLCEKLLDPHTLQIADFDGDGRPDIYTGDMGLGDWTAPHPPVQRLYLSRGGDWEEVVFGEGQGVHEAQVMRIGGRVAVIGKPYRALDAAGPRAKGADTFVLWRW